MNLWKKVCQSLRYTPTSPSTSFSIPAYPSSQQQELATKPISAQWKENMAYFQQAFHTDKNIDVVLRTFTMKNGTEGFLVYIDGMVRSATINEFILKPLFLAETDSSTFMRDIIQINAFRETQSYDAGIQAVLMGDTAICINGIPKIFTCETKGFDKRSVDKPQNESSIKGSQEAFNENIRTNTTLVRRIVKSNDLITEFLTIGEINHNYCAIMYLDHLTNPALVAEVKRRLQSIRSDYVFGSGMIEQFIEDGPFRILPNLLSTERPDTVALHLCQGRVAILVDGTPFALVLPIGLSNLLKSTEDSSMRWQYGTLLRFTRLVSVVLTLLLPAFYVAIVNFHRGMLPTELLIAIAKARENVPFPTVLEILLMEFSFELIREAGVRVPGVIGNTIGIVGGLILGQAAVSANLVSPVMIIIIAFTGIANFAIPDFSFSTGMRILRFLFIVLAGMLGFVGVGLGLVVLVASLTTQTSFGVGTLTPMAPKTATRANLLYNPPAWKREQRPDELNPSRTQNQPPISRRWILKRRNPHE